MSDIEGGWKAYLRARPAIQAVFSTRVFLRPDSKADYPQIVVTRIGGGADTGEAPIDRPLVQFDVWGALNDRHGCYEAKKVLRAELDAIRGGTTVLSAECHLLGIPQVIDDRLLADPSNNRPRYALTVDCTALDPTT